MIRTLTTRFYSTISNKMSKKALVFLAPGAEEMEFVISVDVMRRAGIEVTIAGLPDSKPVTCSRNIVITPDMGIYDVKGDWDAMVLPGGLGGAKALSENKKVGELLKHQDNQGRLIAAICAAPLALKAHQIGIGKTLTSYPQMQKDISEGIIYKYSEDNVVLDGNLITSRGPGTAYQFALTIVECLVDKDTACEVARTMLVNY